MHVLRVVRGRHTPRALSQLRRRVGPAPAAPSSKTDGEPAFNRTNFEIVGLRIGDGRPWSVVGLNATWALGIPVYVVALDAVTLC
jgi:hypothetical protein